MEILCVTQKIRVDHPASDSGCPPVAELGIAEALASLPFQESSPFVEPTAEAPSLKPLLVTLRNALIQSVVEVDMSHEHYRSRI